ncbi:hypothetical protein F4802DRAFT_421499 [Xylaria palmicola]|nr:hypothetical protein F4802DRAFT_421499 [Xylaria palmicola]
MWSFGTTMTMPKDSESVSNHPPERHQPAPIPPAQSQSPPETRPFILSQRSLKQLGFFFAGAGFLSLATLITRRSITRKRLATLPRFYTQSNRPVDKISSDGLIALEALNLATLNVVGFAVMMTGGLSWAFDVSNIDDLRSLARKHIGPSGGQTDEEAEKEIQEFLAKFLHRKEKQEAADPAAPSAPSAADPMAIMTALAAKRNGKGD